MKPRGPELVPRPARPALVTTAIPVNASTTRGVNRAYRTVHRVSPPPIFLPRYSGVRPTINPPRKTPTSAIWSVRPRDIQDASEAALGLKPFGQYAFLLFSAGLLNASVFAACILPLSTAYSVCEGLGFEAGVNKRMREAPVFYFLYTLLIVVGAGVVLIPGFPLVRMILLSQVLNGVLLPFVLIFMIRLINRQDLMGEWVNPRWFNQVSWISVVVMIGLTLALVGITVRGMP